MFCFRFIFFHSDFSARRSSDRAEQELREWIFFLHGGLSAEGPGEGVGWMREIGGRRSENWFRRVSFVFSFCPGQRGAATGFSFSRVFRGRGYAFRRIVVFSFLFRACRCTNWSFVLAPSLQIIQMYVNIRYNNRFPLSEKEA